MYVSIRADSKPTKAIVLGICGVGIPAAIQNLLNVTGMTVLNNFTSAYGSNAVAAMGIAQKINMIPLYIAMGLGQGIMPLISYNYSSGDARRMKKNGHVFRSGLGRFLAVLQLFIMFLQMAWRRCTARLMPN